MKLCKVYIKEFQQFKNFELDFTYPPEHEKQGQPLEKICFIGRNGTGKSTILNLLRQALINLNKTPINITHPTPMMLLKLKIEDDYLYFLKADNLHQSDSFFSDEIDQIENWQNDFFKDKSTNSLLAFNPKYSKFLLASDKIKNKIEFIDNSGDLIVHVPSEGNENSYSKVNDVPAATLNGALQLFDSFPFSHVISTDTIKEFWQVLIYQLKKRENDFIEFQKQDRNLDQTVRKVQAEFEKENPKILDQLALIWNKILSKANLFFDSTNANNPIQLNDNLKAYIYLKGTDKKINYNQLSSGIRNFIFKIGHIYSLYFNRNITKGFLLIDEPENNLYPDFLYDLIDTYFNITQNTQFFVATHSPIIAAQFQPYERFILDFNEDGSVCSRRGETPIGDDPNDMLVKDFGVRSLLGKEGVEKWERYIELKLTIPRVTDRDEKSRLLDEFIKIGNDYNFATDEVS